jgi:hypothetical protein
MLTLSGPLGNSAIDSLIDSITGRAVTSATAAAQPLLDDIERRVKIAIAPIVLLTAGSFIVSLIALKRSKCAIK